MAFRAHLIYPIPLSGITLIAPLFTFKLLFILIYVVFGWSIEGVRRGRA